MKFYKATIIALVAIFAATGITFAADDYCYPLTGDKDSPCEVYLGCPPPGDQNDIDFCIPEEPQNALLNICCCEDVDDTTDFFVPGTEIAIKFKIVDESQGVYFAKYNEHEVDPNFDWAAVNPNSDPNIDNDPNNYPTVLGKILSAYDRDCIEYDDLNPQPTCEMLADDSKTITWERNAWDRDAFDPADPKTLDGLPGEFDWDGFVYKLKNGTITKTAGIPAPNAFDENGHDSNANYFCSVSDADKIVEMWTVELDPVNGGGIGTQDGTRDAGFHVNYEQMDSCWWVFNLPYLVMNWAEAVDHQNETVQVKVELFQLPTTGASICDEGVPICSCIVDAATICDNDQEVFPAMRKMYFPYVISTKPTGGTWTSGIGVSNIDTAIKIPDMEATFIFIDSAGNVFSATKKDFTSQVFAKVFRSSDPNADTLVKEFGWDDINKHNPVIASGTGVLRVQTNFAADGYQYNMYVNPVNGQTFGAGTLPRTQLGLFAWRMPGDQSTPSFFEDDDWDDMVPFNW